MSVFSKLAPVASIGAGLYTGNPALVGSGLSMIGANSAADQQQKALRQAMQAVAFNPSNVDAAGVGSATFSNGQINTALDPQLEQFRQQLLNQAGTTNPLYGQTGSMFAQAGQNIFNQGLGFQGLGQQVSGMGQGLFGLGGNAYGQSQGLFNAGVNQLGAASSTDPFQIAQNQYNLSSQLLNPQQQQARTSLENRLFAQGRLGSTGGSEQFQGLLNSQDQARNQLMSQALGQGLAAQGQLFNQGLGTLGASFNQAGIGSGLFGQGANMIGQGATIGQAGAAQLGQGAGLFGQQLNLQDQQLQQQLQQLNAARTLAQDPLQLVSMGLNRGNLQATAGVNTANLLTQAGNINPTASALTSLGGVLGSLGNTGSLFGTASPAPVQPSYYGNGYVPPGGSFTGATDGTASLFGSAF